MTARPESEWVPSPNFNARPGPVTAIVIHATETSGIDSPRAHLCDPASKASAHYLIGKTGIILHLVHESERAWHAGVSSWDGKDDVNDFSVGIELVNENDGVAEYSQDQLTAAAALCRAMMTDYGVNTENVIGHADIAPGRKTDPGAMFPWGSFRAMLA